MMRLDPDLCFATRCLPPDPAEIEEVRSAYQNLGEDDEDSQTPTESRASSVKPEETVEAAAAAVTATAAAAAANGETQLHPFPSATEVNGRLRRLVSSSMIFVTLISLNGIFFGLFLVMKFVLFAYFINPLMLLKLVS